jgi:glyoxylase-like metal-dependent hydrolase (beta-lactamase superfamily II)
MTEWFTVDKIDSDTFAISEYKHWEETHCYLLCGNKGAVLIDTGLGIGNIQNVVGNLTTLSILVVTTHTHWDHIGGHEYFDNFAVFEDEKEWLAGQFPIPLEMVKKNLLSRPCAFPEDFDINQYRVFQGLPAMILHDGDLINLGNRQLKVIHTPGHSPGHCCFYEPDKGYLYSGDLIYKGCLDAFYPTTNPQSFLSSLEKVKLLAINKVLPGHHQLNISVDIVSEIATGFRKLANEGKLKQGNGIYDFGDFQIHI